MKIWKNAFSTALIALFVLGVFAVPLSFAQGPTTVTAPSVDDTGLGPESTFSIDVMIQDVNALVAFDFRVYYDTSVLTATGCEGYYPFTYPLPTLIDDVEGNILVGASYPPPETIGFYTADPYPVIRIDFSVDGYGASMFDIQDAVFANVLGEEMPITVVNGWFRNVAGAPIAWFAPTEPAVINTPVTFTSLSIDPEGGPLTLVWNPGETYTWTEPGTYLVTLTATNILGISDIQTRTIEITLPPLAGAIAVKGMPTHAYNDFTKYGDRVLILKAWAKNIDLTREEYVRVEIWLYDDYGLGHGAITAPYQWILPGAKAEFQGTFYMLDPARGFVGDPYRRSTINYIAYVKVYYADYFIGGDINNPHWAVVEDQPEISFAFTVHESRPVPVPVATQTGPTTVFLDGTASYDPDEKWGDSITTYRWIVYDAEGNMPYLVWGPTYTVDLPPGYYDIALRCEDTFGVRVTKWTSIEVV